MKVIIHYEDNENENLFKSLKITLPKSWKTGPTSRLLEQFVESYNSNPPSSSEAAVPGTEDIAAAEATVAPVLDASTLRLAIRSSSESGSSSKWIFLPSDAIVMDVVPERADVYVQHGPSSTMAEMAAQRDAARKLAEQEKSTLVQCTRLGCRQRFPRGGPYPSCVYHKSPPCFHETAKWWSCCPNKKAYDWDDFQSIPGCQTGVPCIEHKESTEGSDGSTKQFLGGTDLREQISGGGNKPVLKSIDDFNKAQAAGGADAAPVLDRLRNAVVELGIETELYDQVIEGIRKEVVASNGAADEASILGAVKAELGNKLKSALKSIAVEQLRIK
jgi:CHORD